MTLVVTAAACGSVAPIALATQSVGDTRVFAKVPDPGQPAGIARVDGRVHVTTAGLGQPTAAPHVFSYDLTNGDLLGSKRIEPMMSPSGMALYGVAADEAGRLYVVDMNGRVLRLDPATGVYEEYALFPASLGGAGTMPFDIAFDGAGFAYVTDQNVPGIWRIPPGGGEPELWFSDPRLFGYFFGPAGIRLDPAGDHLYFAVSYSQHPATARAGVVYRLPVEDAPGADELEEVHRYEGEAFPYGLAFGDSGRLYVTLAGPDQISILDPGADGDFAEATRFPSAAQNAVRTVPYDTPVGVAFDGKGSLLVTNSNAFSVPDRSRWAILQAYVGDTAAPLATPAIAP